MSGLSLPAVSLVLLCAICFPLTSSRTAGRSEPVSPVIKERLQSARALFLNGKYDEAREVYVGALQAHPSASPEDRAALLIGIATSHFAQRQFRVAQRYYNEAAEVVSKQNNLVELQLAIATNRASLYRQMGDEKGATEVWRGTERLVDLTRSPMLITQFANSVRASDPHRALRLFAKALDAVEGWYPDIREGLSIRATIWSQIGVTHWQRKDFRAAEAAFTESYRLRLMSKKPAGLQTTYAQLGVLRRMAGDLRSSRTLLQRARALVAEGLTPLTVIENALALAALRAFFLRCCARHSRGAWCRHA